MEFKHGLTPSLQSSKGMLCISVILSAVLFPCVSFIFRLASLKEAKCSSFHTLHHPEEERESLIQHPTHSADSFCLWTSGWGEGQDQENVYYPSVTCAPGITGKWEGRKASRPSWGVTSSMRSPFWFHPLPSLEEQVLPLNSHDSQSALLWQHSPLHILNFGFLLDHLHLLLQSNSPLFSTPLCYVLYPRRWTISLFNPHPSDFLLYTTPLK